jgi:hypothetical protein
MSRFDANAFDEWSGLLVEQVLKTGESYLCISWSSFWRSYVRPLRNVAQWEDAGWFDPRLGDVTLVKSGIGVEA